jgi:hypothetical protein
LEEERGHKAVGLDGLHQQAKLLRGVVAGVFVPGDEFREPQLSGHATREEVLQGGLGHGGS